MQGAGGRPARKKNQQAFIVKWMHPLMDYSDCVRLHKQRNAVNREDALMEFTTTIQ